jgi:adenylate kinase
MRLVFLGPPGAGKGTQAIEIAEQFDLTHLSTGDLLRSEIKARSDLGLEAKEFMDRGAFVPDDLVVEMVLRRIAGLDRYLLDGFPRTEPQAAALDDRAGEEAVDTAFHFALDDDLIVARLSGRRTCSNCGAIYHVETMPPKKEGTCDRCGGELIQRDDDRPETIRRRIEVSRRELGPVVRYYEKRGICARIDASKAPREVKDAIVAFLEAGGESR